MNTLLWIVSSSEGISLGFKSMADADAFLRKQSCNPGWLSQWKLEYLGDGEVKAVCTQHVVLHFQ